MVTPAGAGGKPPRTAASAAASMAPTPLLPTRLTPLTAPERLTVKRTLATPPAVPAAASRFMRPRIAEAIAPRHAAMALGSLAAAAEPVALWREVAAELRCELPACAAWARRAASRSAFALAALIRASSRFFSWTFSSSLRRASRSASRFFYSAALRRSSILGSGLGGSGLAATGGGGAIGSASCASEVTSCSSGRGGGVSGTASVTASGGGGG